MKSEVVLLCGLVCSLRWWEILEFFFFFYFLSFEVFELTSNLYHVAGLGRKSLSCAVPVLK